MLIPKLLEGRFPLVACPGVKERLLNLYKQILRNKNPDDLEYLSDYVVGSGATSSIIMLGKWDKEKNSNMFTNVYYGIVWRL